MLIPTFYLIVIDLCCLGEVFLIFQVVSVDIVFLFGLRMFFHVIDHMLKYFVCLFIFFIVLAVTLAVSVDYVYFSLIIGHDKCYLG